MAYDEEMMVLDNPLLKQEEEVQYGGYNQSPEQAMAQDFPPLAQPSQQPAQEETAPPVNPRQQYIDAQLRLADLIRQRGEREVNVPPAERQPSPEELGLKAQIAQTGQELGPSPAAEEMKRRYLTPVTRVDAALQQLNREESRKNQAIRNVLGAFRARNVAEAGKALAYYQQYVAQNRWETIYQDQINQGVPDDAARRKAWGDVSPMVFTSAPQALSSVLRAAQPPPAAPAFVPADKVTGAPAHFRTGAQGTGVQQIRANPQSDYEKLHHAGDKLLRLNPDGSTVIIFDASAGKVSQLDHMKFTAANHVINQITPKLLAADDVTRAQMNRDLTEARNTISDIMAKYEKPKEVPLTRSPAVATRQADEGLPVQPPTVSTIPPGEERAAPPPETTPAPKAKRIRYDSNGNRIK